LASLYTVRIISGAVAVEAEVTFWLLAFSLFFFFSLAMVKRYSELAGLAERGESGAIGRGYYASDASLISVLGVGSGYLSVLIFALYLNEKKILMQYSDPLWLWLITPVLLYWVSRVWLLVNRRQIDEDPVLFAVKDRISYIAGLICITSIVLAR
jgi:4-hydroxybenzoate polyprenyltransferase